MTRRGRPDRVLPARDIAAAAAFLRAIGNERRLMVLCKLVEWGEATVGTLVEAVGISQSALSQHLATMRDEGLITFRRDAQTLWYRIEDGRAERLLATLHDLFCRQNSNKKGNVPDVLAISHAERSQASDGRWRRPDRHTRSR